MISYLWLLFVLDALITSGVDLPIIATLQGIDNTATSTPTAGSPFSWSDGHSSCRNNNPTIDGGYGFCAGGNSDPASYFQVDLQNVYDISSVGIVGRADAGNQYVKTYNLEYSTDGSTFISDGISNPLTGSNEKTTEVKTAFSADIAARYLRVIPVTWNDHKSFRFEAYGELAHPECESIDIDGLLHHCSSSYDGLTEVVQTNEEGIESVNDRIDNLIANSASFYQGSPDQAAAQSYLGNEMDPNEKIWFHYDRDNLLMLSLIMNISIIVFGSIICLKAGVCSKAFCDTKRVNKYRKVKAWTSDNDDENQVIVK